MGPGLRRTRPDSCSCSARMNDASRGLLPMATSYARKRGQSFEFAPTRRACRTARSPPKWALGGIVHLAEAITPVDFRELPAPLPRYHQVEVQPADPGALRQIATALDNDPPDQSPYRTETFQRTAEHRPVARPLDRPTPPRTFHRYQLRRTQRPQPLHRLLQESPRAQSGSSQASGLDHPTSRATSTLVGVLRHGADDHARQHPSPTTAMSSPQRIQWCQAQQALFDHVAW